MQREDMYIFNVFVMEIEFIHIIHIYVLSFIKPILYIHINIMKRRTSGKQNS